MRKIANEREEIQGLDDVISLYKSKPFRRAVVILNGEVLTDKDGDGFALLCLLSLLI